MVTSVGMSRCGPFSPRTGRATGATDMDFIATGTEPYNFVRGSLFGALR